MCPRPPRALKRAAVPRLISARQSGEADRSKLCPGNPAKPRSWALVPWTAWHVPYLSICLYLGRIYSPSAVRISQLSVLTSQFHSSSATEGKLSGARPTPVTTSRPGLAAVTHRRLPKRRAGFLRTPGRASPRVDALIFAMTRACQLGITMTMDGVTWLSRTRTSWSGLPIARNSRLSAPTDVAL